jgi:hypothetical protein
MKPRISGPKEMMCGVENDNNNNNNNNNNITGWNGTKCPL